MVLASFRWVLPVQDSCSRSWTVVVCLCPTCRLINRVLTGFRWFWPVVYLMVLASGIWFRPIQDSPGRFCIVVAGFI